MKSPYDIILRPVLTEKSYDAMADKKYTFEVAVDAGKTEIKMAVEQAFEGVKVESVNTMRVKGKVKRQGRTQGRRPERKKAIVTLKKDSKGIEFFEGMAEHRGLKPRGRASPQRLWAQTMVRLADKQPNKLRKGEPKLWPFECTSRLRPRGASCRC